MYNSFFLDEKQVQLLKKVHLKHLNAMGTEMRKNYTVEQIKKVIWNSEEKCLNVYYKNGNWWHYSNQNDGVWY